MVGVSFVRMGLKSNGSLLGADLIIPDSTLPTIGVDLLQQYPIWHCESTPTAHGINGEPVSLNAYWILDINANSPNVELAYRFLRHCASPEMDKLLTLEGGIGCRKSTWTSVEVNAEIPFYHRMASLHEHARELPRLANWADIAAVIDELVQQTINTPVPIATLLEQAQHKL